MTFHRDDVLHTKIMRSAWSSMYLRQLARIHTPGTRMDACETQRRYATQMRMKLEYYRKMFASPGSDAPPRRRRQKRLNIISLNQLECGPEK